MALCKSCGAEILWKRTASGKAIPLDPEPSSRGNVQIGFVGGEEMAIVVSAADALAAQADGQSLYLSHFATCPEAGKHRK